jgi:hypothetical protein
VTSDQNTVTRNDFTRFQNGEVANQDVLQKDSIQRIITAVRILTDPNIDLLLPSITNDLDGTIFLFLIECAELALFFPVVDGTDHDDNHDSNDNGDTFDKVDTRGLAETRRVVATGLEWVRYANVLIDTKRQRNDSGNAQ